MSKVRKKKVLFIAEGVSLAHPTRLSQLCLAADHNDFEIHFATSANYLKLLQLNPRHIHLHTIASIANSIFNERLFHAKFPFSLQELNIAVNEDELLINKIKPDLIIGDFRLSLCASAKKFSIPLVQLIQYHWHHSYERPALIPLVKPMEIVGRRISQILDPWVTPLILSKQLKTINQFRNEYNLAPCKRVFDFYYDSDYLLFPDLEELFKPLPKLSNAEFIGPILWKPPRMPWPEKWKNVPIGRKLAYVSMGSTGHHDSVPLIVKQLRIAGFEVLLSSAGHQYSGLAQEGVWIAPFVPFDLILQHSNLIICNGGTGTTYHALSHGVPVLGIPSNLDQCLHMDILKRNKVADYIYPDQISSYNLLEKFFQLCHSYEIQEPMYQIQNSIFRSQRNFDINQLLNKIMNRANDQEQIPFVHGLTG